MTSVSNNGSAPLDGAKANSYNGRASYPFMHRLYRLIWLATWFVLCRWTPPPFHWWRRGILRLFGAEIASSAHIYGSARIWYPRNLVMKDFATLAPNVNCYNMDNVSIGIHGIVSQGAFLCGGTHDVDNPHLQLTVAPINIGDFAWVAAEAFIGPGVTLGEGAVVGARSVTFRNIGSWEIWAGNPAKFIRGRIKNSG